ECLPVLEIHGPCYCWGQTCDEVRLGPATSGSLGSGGGVVEAADEYGADVVGTGQSAARDHSRKHLVEVVTVGFGSAELRGQRCKGVGGKELFDVGLQPDAVDQLRPAVVLG